MVAFGQALRTATVFCRLRRDSARQTEAEHECNSAIRCDGDVVLPILTSPGVGGLLSR